MKIMKYIVPALLGGMLTLQSCEHFLDTKPTETYSEELVWESVYCRCIRTTHIS